MEGRMRKYGGQPSSPPTVLKQPEQARKVPVVYYLCRNRHLEHPHFIEVHLSSPEGLYLRDVLMRLIVLRGKGMPAMYSWSCKRSYKNGFVWHDLSEDDLILPTNGNEFVLKGSELFDQSSFDKAHHNEANGKLQNPKSLQSETPTSSRTNETFSSSSYTTFKDSKFPLPPSPSAPPSPQGLQLAHPLGSSSNISLKAVPASLSEYMASKPCSATDASTQTEDLGRKSHGRRKATCIRGVSTVDGSLDFQDDKMPSNHASMGPELCRDETSPPPTSSSASSSGGKMETLESLIREDVNKINSFRILEEEEIFIPTGPRLKATNMLMQLITCGSISVKDHKSFGFVPTYKPKFSHVKFPSPMFSSTMVLGELDYLSEKSRFIGLRMEDKEYFSGSLLETKKIKEDVREVLSTLKRSSSYNADRSSTSPHSTRETQQLIDSSHSKYLPRSVKIAPNKPTGDGISSSPIANRARNSSADPDCHQSSINGSKRLNDISSEKGSSFREDKDNKTIMIEERLLSGARVMIQSRASYDDNEDN